MQYAVTLPQLGRATSGTSIRDTARFAEDLDFSDVWAIDHIGFASETNHPSPRMYEPLTALAMAAAVTERIGIGFDHRGLLPADIPCARSQVSTRSAKGG